MYCLFPTLYENLFSSLTFHYSNLEAIQSLKNKHLKHKKLLYVKIDKGMAIK